MRTYVRMGRANTPHALFRRTLERGDFSMAMSLAKRIAISDYDALRLTMAAAVLHSPLYDAMAGRWIAKLASKRKLKLAELGWLVERFEEAERGAAGPAEKALVRFLGDGWDLPH